MRGELLPRAPLLTAVLALKLPGVESRAYSIALPMSSTTFLASPNTIMVLSM